MKISREQAYKIACDVAMQTNGYKVGSMASTICDRLNIETGHVYDPDNAFSQIKAAIYKKALAAEELRDPIEIITLLPDVLLRAVNGETNEGTSDETMP